MEYSLVPFIKEFAAEVIRWPASVEELENWCSRADLPLRDPGLLAAWHEESGVEPFALLRGQALVAYGEVWTEEGLQEVELGRLIVSPAWRRRGAGGALVRALLARASASGFREAFVRVRARNAAALALYRGAGFARVSAAEERRFNAGQPHDYVWLRRELSRP